MRRYQVSRQSIHSWRRLLGFSTDQRNKHWYSPKEVIALDHYFVACHVLWGLRMNKQDYEREVLDKGIDLDQYLQACPKQHCTYDQYLEKRNQTWLKFLCAN